ncbi:MAG: aminotransferase class V-fold PLP-dependent enzyme [Polyangiaceae bacterium]|nr:aminotransferase class V-fold PLP-dependent enzyme [Polyangiaceae bacterium]
MASDVFALDPSLTHLNHGSYGACPREVLAHQAALRARLEAAPTRFFSREYEPLLDEARARVAAFVGADPAGLAFVPNATTGIACVLASASLEVGDELLVTSHGYGACKNAAAHAAARAGAALVVADVPFPVASADEIVLAVTRAVTPRTRLALIDHVTSPTALVFPIERLVRELQARGVDVLVDAAHAAGQVPLALAALGAAYATGNLHKWTCAPKGAAFLHVRADRRDRVRPVVISHGATARRGDRSRFHLEFDWTGTFDPSAWLAAPRALDVMAREFGGWDAIRRDNHALAQEGRALVADALGVAPPAPMELLGAMASLELFDPAPPARASGEDALQRWLLEEHRIEIPVLTLGARRLLRLSAQRYNTREDYERLARALRSRPR